VPPQANVLRAAGNVAQLSAAAELAFSYLAAEWSGATAEYEAFANTDAVYLLRRVLGGSRDEQDCHVLLRSLAELHALGRVSIEDDPVARPDSSRHVQVVGRYVPPDEPQWTGTGGQYLFVMSGCLAAVNTFLREQGRPEIRASHPALYRGLRAAGLLLGRDGRVLSVGDDDQTDPTESQRVGGRTCRVFRVPAGALSAEAAAG